MNRLMNEYIDRYIEILNMWNLGAGNEAYLQLTAKHKTEIRSIDD